MTHIDFIPLDVAEGEIFSRDVVNLVEENKQYFLDDLNNNIMAFLHDLTLFAVVAKGNFIGFIGVEGVNGYSCSLHCASVKGFERYIFRAGKEFLRLCFKAKIKRIEVLIPEFNHKSIKFVKSLGFKKEGCLRAFRTNNKKPVNYNIYSILDKEI